MVTSCCGFSFASQRVSDGTQPILKVPGGMKTYSSRSRGFVGTVSIRWTIAVGGSDHLTRLCGHCKRGLTDLTRIWRHQAQPGRALDRHFEPARALQHYD